MIVRFPAGSYKQMEYRWCDIYFTPEGFGARARRDGGAIACNTSVESIRETGVLLVQIPYA